MKRVSSVYEFDDCYTAARNGFRSADDYYARSSSLFAISGILLWYGKRDTRFRFAVTIVLHDGLMWISLVLLAGHLYLSVIYPRTRHSLRGIVRGDVELQWALEHHPKWVKDVLASHMEDGAG